MARSSAPFRLPPLQSIICAGALIAAGGGLALFLFAGSGLYNVAASSGHWPITRALLTFGLESSVRTHSIGIDVPPLDDADMVRLGAGHFARSCSPCHGAPGEPIGPQPASMLPPPPVLSGSAADWSAAELYWIVRHGIKYTAMPGWPDQRRADEVWSIVAFLERLPQLSEPDYRALIGPEADERPSGVSGEIAPAVANCVGCHGPRGGQPPSALVPRLDILDEAYLVAALRDYAAGRRWSGVMRTVAAELSETEIGEAARYYAGSASAVATPGDPADPALLQRGAGIFRDGVAAKGVPACASCHGEGRNERFPSLDGQSRRYLSEQLRLLRDGRRGDTAFIDIMRTVASRLGDEEIEAVAAYLASLRPKVASPSPGPTLPEGGN